MQARGFDRSRIKCERFLHMRYEKTDCALMISGGEEGTGFEEAFLAQYLREFGFTIPGRPLVIDDVRVRATASGTPVVDRKVRVELENSVCLYFLNDHTVWCDSTARLESNATTVSFHRSRTRPESPSP